MSEPSIVFLSFFRQKKKSVGESLFFFSAAVCDNIPADNTLKNLSIYFLFGGGDLSINCRISFSCEAAAVSDVHTRVGTFGSVSGCCVRKWREC